VAAAIILFVMWFSKSKSEKKLSVEKIKSRCVLHRLLIYTLY